MPYTNINLANLTALVQARLDSTTFWTPQEITDSLNDALKLYQLATGRWRDRFAIPTQANRVIYDLTQIAQFLSATNVTKILAVLRIVHQGTGATPQPMGATSFTDLDFCYPGWQISTTASSGYPSTPMLWCPFGGVNLVATYPADLLGTNSLQFDCLLTTPVLVNQSDWVNLSTDETVALIGEAVCTLAWKRGGINLAQTLPLHEQFLRMLQDRSSYLSAIDGFRKAMGDDASRRLRPRRIRDLSGIMTGIGLR